MVTYSEWKSDTMMNVAVLYNMTAQVLDKSGTVLAENNISSKETVGSSLINSPAAAAKAVPIAFRRKLEQLLGAKNIMAALK